MHQKCFEKLFFSPPPFKCSFNDGKLAAKQNNCVRFHMQNSVHSTSRRTGRGVKPNVGEQRLQIIFFWCGCLPSTLYGRQKSLFLTF
jgi:hypothetical protein